jgi:hypothetical protein
MSNYSNRRSLATVSSAFSDLPAPPYSHPEEYEALVEAMVQELYHLNPEWVERKQRLQEVCDSSCNPSLGFVFIPVSRC